MSFSELPQVDDNAKRSEESVIAVRSLFTKRNGFISEEVSDDYGYDLEVELILNSVGASGKKFPIQIKSSSVFKTVTKENQEFITRSFETSRLNYLCQRPPAYGLVVFYDDQRKKCYFDFVEQIVQRLTTEKENDDWKKQQTVSVHISKNNILNNESVKTIYEQLSNRFEAQELLIKNYGSQFNIPSFSLSQKEGNEDIRNLSSLDILKKYGLLFINPSDIHFLYELLSHVSVHDTLSSRDLLFMACIAYGEMGKCLEAELYLTKAFQIIDQFEDHEKETLQFVRIKVDFLLGKRNREAFLSDLKNMRSLTRNQFNSLQISINLVYFNIIQKIESNELDDTLETNILQIFAEIEQSNVDQEKKMFLRVFHAEMLHMYISSRMLKWISRLRVKEALNIEVNHREKIQMFLKSNTLVNTATMQVISARSYAIKENNKSLQAYAEYAIARFFQVKEFDFLLLRYRENDPEREKNYKRSFIFAIHAHNLFLELGLLKDARLALICAYDLSRLARLYHNLDISTSVVSDETLKTNLMASEREMGLTEPYVSIVDKAYEDLLKEQKETDPQRAFADMTDDRIQLVAQTVLKSYSLPPQRLINIVNEMKALKYFSNFCNINDYEVLTDNRHYQSKHSHYSYPSVFIIRSKRTNLESLPSTDIEKLAAEFGALKSK